jgi:hypothetical protein
MKDERKQKIADLKNKIILLDSELVEMAKAKPENSPDLTEEQHKELLKEFQDNSTKKRAELISIKEELKQTKLNKTGSKFFSFTPSSTNRSQARRFRKLRKA